MIQAKEYDELIDSSQCFSKSTLQLCAYAPKYGLISVYLPR